MIYPDVSEHPYQPFTGHDATCPKCGGTLDSSFQTAGTAFISQGYTTIGAGRPEWMLRRCIECGFERPEMCRDAYPETALQERQP